MKFKIGDKVKEIRGFNREATVIEAIEDHTASSHEWYNVKFEDGSVQGTDGKSFVLIETDFISLYD